MKVLILVFFAGLNIPLILLSIIICIYVRSQKMPLYSGVFCFFSEPCFLYITYSEDVKLDLGSTLSFALKPSTKTGTVSVIHFEKGNGYDVFSPFTKTPGINMLKYI